MLSPHLDPGLLDGRERAFLSMEWAVGMHLQPSTVEFVHLRYMKIEWG